MKAENLAQAPKISKDEAAEIALQAVPGNVTDVSIEKKLGADRNPKDALINKDPRMKAALRKYAAEMRQASFDYNHPDEVETVIRERLAAFTSGGTIRGEPMSPDQIAALTEFQNDEWKRRLRRNGIIVKSNEHCHALTVVVRKPTRLNRPGSCRLGALPG